MKILNSVKIIISFIAALLLAVATANFLNYNNPIIKGLYLNISLIMLVIALLGMPFLEVNYKRTKLHSFEVYFKPLFFIASSAILIIVFLESALYDYFQPFSGYDDVIYLVLAAFVIYIIRFAIELIQVSTNKSSYLTTLLVLAIPASLFVWNKLQTPFKFGVEEEHVSHLFSAKDAGYDIFRIPSIYVIPEGSKLANGEILAKDRVLIFAEARRNGSLDHGDIDLVQRISQDAGISWSSIAVTKSWEKGIGKVGNPTPVFDTTTGLFWMFYLAGDFARVNGYHTYYINSNDGGITWNKPQKFGDGAMGPGHGIQITKGPNTGKLLIPGYNSTGAFAIISTDNGLTWTKSKNVGVGNETEIAQADSLGNLIMITRAQIPMSESHDKLHKLISFSTEGGTSWAEPKENLGLKTPLCMSSIIYSNNKL